MLRSLPLLLAAALSIAAGPAAALMIDFEEFAHGEIVAAPVASHAGYTLIVENFRRRFDAAVAFDTGVTRGRERDLRFDDRDDDRDDDGDDDWDDDWDHDGDDDSDRDFRKDLSTILILQANSDCDSTRCFEPESENRRPAGKFTFLLDEIAVSFAFDLIGIDGKERKKTRITFFLLEEGSVANTVASFRLEDFGKGKKGVDHIDLGSFGSFNAFEIVLGGSGGIDNIDAPPIPEPATAAMIGLGLSALAIAGRRRR